MIICLQDLISDFNIEKQIVKYLAGGEKEGWGKETCLQDLISNTLTRRMACLARYESFATVGEIRVWWRADFQSGSRVLKKVF